MISKKEFCDKKPLERFLLGRARDFWRARYHRLPLHHKVTLSVIATAVVTALLIATVYMAVNHWTRTRVLPRERALRDLESISATLLSETREYLLLLEESTLLEIEEAEDDLKDSLLSLDPNRYREIIGELENMFVQSRNVSDLGRELATRRERLVGEYAAINDLLRWFRDRMHRFDGSDRDLFGLLILLQDARAAAFPFDRGITEEGSDQRMTPVLAGRISLMGSSMTEEVREIAVCYLDHLTMGGIHDQIVRDLRKQIDDGLDELEVSENNLEEKIGEALTHSAEEARKIFLIEQILSIASLALGLIVMTLAVVFISRRTNRDLVAIADSARTFGMDNLSHRVTVPPAVDTGRVAETYNEVADQLSLAISERFALERALLDQDRDLAREAGRAEVATTILHNVGNILNSLVTTCYLLSERWLKPRKLESLKRANTEFSRILSTLPEAEQLKFTRLEIFLSKFTGLLEKEERESREMIDRVVKKVDLIRDVVLSQQNAAKKTLNAEMLDVRDVARDSLMILESNSRARDIVFVKAFSSVPAVLAQRNSLTHVLVNLLENARDALDGERWIRVAVLDRERHVEIRVEDRGVGIPPEHLTKVFQHGFTTKKNGHGFGLHGCAISIQEMGGKIWAESEGLGKGASFCISLPVEPVGSEIVGAESPRGHPT